MNNNCRILVSGDSLKFLKKENYNIENWGECKVKGENHLWKFMKFFENSLRKI